MSLLHLPGSTRRTYSPTEMYTHTHIYTIIMPYVFVDISNLLCPSVYGCSEKCTLKTNVMCSKRSYFICPPFLCVLLLTIKFVLILIPLAPPLRFLLLNWRSTCNCQLVFVFALQNRRGWRSRRCWRTATTSRPRTWTTCSSCRWTTTPPRRTRPFSPPRDCSTMACRGPTDPSSRASPACPAWRPSQGNISQISCFLQTRSPWSTAQLIWRLIRLPLFHCSQPHLYLTAFLPKRTTWN